METSNLSGFYQIRTDGENTEAGATRQLLRGLMEGVEALKGDVGLLTTPPPAIRIPTLQLPTPTMDFRKKAQTPRVAKKVMSQTNLVNLEVKIKKLEEEVSYTHRKAINTQIDEDLPVYGRGDDPPMEFQNTYMFRSPQPKPKQYSEYTTQFASYLTQKAVKQQKKKEPEVITQLRQIYTNADMAKSGFASKYALQQEIQNWPKIARQFGLRPNQQGNIFENFGSGDVISLQQFLTCFQLMNNNLIEEVKEKKAKSGSQKKSKGKVAVQIEEGIIDDDQQIGFAERPLGSSKSEFKITVPEPFQFDNRESSKQESIRQRKLRQMLEQQDKEVVDECKVTIRANPVPPEVKQPLFHDIMNQQQQRRETVKQQSIALTKAREAPFSFYYRDIAKSQPQLVQQNVPTQFKANPVPWECTVPRYYELQQEQEAARRQRHQEYVMKMQQEQNQYPRLGNFSKPKEVPKVVKQKKPKYKAKPIPDFEKLQNQFSAKLDACKVQFSPTVPQEFDFQQSRNVCKHTDVFNDQQQAKTKWGKRAKSKSLSCLNPPKIEPGITKKVKQMFEKTRENIAKKEHQYKLKKQEEKERIARRKKVEPQVRSCKVIRGNKKELEERKELIKYAIKKSFQRNAEQYMRERAEMEQRVGARKLLVEMVEKAVHQQARQSQSIDLTSEPYENSQILEDEDDSIGLQDF